MPLASLDGHASMQDTLHVMEFFVCAYIAGSVTNRSAGFGCEKTCIFHNEFFVVIGAGYKC